VADIRQAGGAEQRVADRVREAVGVGMALEPIVGRKLHAAEHQRAPGNQAVDVVAVTDAEGSHRNRRRERSLSSRLDFTNQKVAADLRAAATLGRLHDSS